MEDDYLYLSCLYHTYFHGISFKTSITCHVPVVLSGFLKSMQTTQLFITVWSIR